MSTRVIGKIDFYGALSYEMAPTLFKTPLTAGSSPATAHKFMYEIYPHYGWASDESPKKTTFKQEGKGIDGEADSVRKASHRAAGR